MGRVVGWSGLVVPPKDRPDEQGEARRLADIAERVYPVPEAVLDTARDAFRSRQRRKHSPTEEVPVDGKAERAGEATDDDMS